MRLCASVCVLLVGMASLGRAQEVQTRHGFIFYSGSYRLDEQTFGLYEEGHKYEALIKDVPLALSKFKSYRTLHTLGNVSVGLGLAAFVLGAVKYMPAVGEDLPESMGIASFGTGGGLLILGLVFEFISWSSLGASADVYNHATGIEDGSALAPQSPRDLLLGFRF